ncbi:MAG: hypothetical protein AAB368_02105, partial [bacterium]
GGGGGGAPATVLYKALHQAAQTQLGSKIISRLVGILVLGVLVVAAAAPASAEVMGPAAAYLHPKAAAATKTRPIPLLPQKLKASGAPIDPAVTLAADKRQAATGDIVTFTGVVSVPTSETQIAYNGILSFQPCSYLSPQTATVPALCDNQALANAVNAAGQALPQAASAIVRIRILGKGGSVGPAGGQWVIPLGDFAPGDAATVLFTCKVL